MLSADQEVVSSNPSKSSSQTFFLHFFIVLVITLVQFLYKSQDKEGGCGKRLVVGARVSCRTD